MSNIINNLNFYMSRGEPEKLTKYKIKQDDLGSHLVNEKKEKEYDYYSCDNCKAEIKIEKKWEERKGGVLRIPRILSKTSKPFCLALCTKCMNEVLKDFENR